jgi:pyruvate/2-oxoglutarate dehydrogenase complex dihydrolipoamide dehydrogenase (E3) component
LRFRKATIATGARASVPPIPGLANSGFLTNETVFELEALPPRLAVLGAGPIGCELAQAFARFGSRVTLLDRDSRMLPRDDIDAASILGESLEHDGVSFFPGTQVSNVTRRGGDIEITYAREGLTEQTTVDAVLVATGRTPNTDGLDLERAGVAYDDKGIGVDARLRTTNRKIFACGDVTGGFQFTHAADAAARTVIRNALFLGRTRADRAVVPWCTYTDPEVAHVGMTSSVASAAAHVETITIPYAELDRARLDGAERGFLRVHVDRRRGRILGAGAVGERAGETIGQISLAMTAGLTLGSIAEAVYPYPTYGEAIKKVADTWRRGKLTPFSRRILNLIRHLGVRF